MRLTTRETDSHEIDTLVIDTREIDAHEIDNLRD